MINLELCRNSVFRFALNMTNDWNLAEDLTQECMLRAVKNSQQLENQKSVLSWLFKITRNIWIDSFRKKKLQTEHFDENQQTVRGWLNIACPTKLNETLEDLLQQMQQLPHRQRQVLFLHAVEDFSIDEISESLELNRSAVKANLSLARKSMRKHANKQLNQ